MKIIHASQAQIDPAILLGLGVGAEDDLDSRHSHHESEADHDHDDFDSFVVRGGAVADVEALTADLRTTLEAHDVLRLKGSWPSPARPPG